MTKISFYTFINSSFILALIAVSGSAAFFSFSLGYLVIILLLLFIYRGMKLPLMHILFLFLTGSIILFQNIYHSGNLQLLISTVAFSNVLATYLISRLVKVQFSIIYRKIIIIICIVSMFFWIGIQISNEFHAILLDFARELPQLSSDKKMELVTPDLYYHLYIFTVPLGNTIRNSGLFFEPGRFAIFIGIALAINLFREKTKFVDKEDFLYILTMISTFSTTGYYVLLFLISARLLISYNKPIHIFIGILFLTLIIGYINTLDFMWEKVYSDYNDNNTVSRFAAMGYHMELIAQSPIIGWGNNIKKMEMSPNGLTMLILRWGSVFSIIYYILLFKGITTLIGNVYSQISVKIVVYMALILLAFSQTATVDAFYFALMFFGLNNYNNK